MNLTINERIIDKQGVELEDFSIILFLFYCINTIRLETSVIRVDY